MGDSFDKSHQRDLAYYLAAMSPYKDEMTAALNYMGRGQGFQQLGLDDYYSGVGASREGNQQFASNIGGILGSLPDIYDAFPSFPGGGDGGGGDGGFYDFGDAFDYSSLFNMADWG